MALDRKIGPYLYQDGWKAEKKFEFDRTFTVVVSGAYDAGIIGPEINGILVLDDDNRSVVLDQHMRANSGYDGPTQRQQEEFKRIVAMDWSEFARFCHDNPRFRRNSAPDIATLSGPDRGDSLNRAIASGEPMGLPGKSILLPEMVEANADPEGLCEFPLSTRDDIIVFLARHHGHVPANYNNGGFVLAWDIKVRGHVDATGRNNGEPTEFALDDRFDKAWGIYAEENSGELFSNACSDALCRWTDGNYSTYPGDDDGSYGFATNGRSGGHLILTEWDGPNPPNGG